MELPEVKTAIVENNTFKTSGECPDEIVLVFDDDKKLYVSKGFLFYASRTFKETFLEKENKEVQMVGKSLQDFHEFLLCLHPGEQKPINRENVLRIVTLAAQFQVKRSVFKCKQVMKSWIDSEYQSVLRDPVQQSNYAKTCLAILGKAVENDFHDMLDFSVKALGRVSYSAFTGTSTANASLFRTSSHKSMQAKVDDDDRTVSQCKKLFDELPQSIKIKVLLERLKLCDDYKVQSNTLPSYVQMESY